MNTHDTGWKAHQQRLGTKPDRTLENILFAVFLTILCVGALVEVINGGVWP